MRIAILDIETTDFWADTGHLLFNGPATLILNRSVARANIGGIFDE